MSVDINVNTTETNVNINASTIVETVDITATVQQDIVEIDVFPNVTVVNVTKKEGEDGQDGTNGVDGVDGVNGTDGQDGQDGVDGKSAYQSYLDTTTDSPKLSETEWSANKKRFIAYTLSGGVFSSAASNKIFYHSASPYAIPNTVTTYSKVFMMSNNYDLHIGRKALGSKLKKIYVSIQKMSVDILPNRIAITIFAKKLTDNYAWDSPMQNTPIVLYDGFVTPNGLTKTIYKEITPDNITIPDGYNIGLLIGFESYVGNVTFYSASIDLEF